MSCILAPPIPSAINGVSLEGAFTMLETLRTTNPQLADLTERCMGIKPVATTPVTYATLNYDELRAAWSGDVCPNAFQNFMYPSGVYTASRFAAVQIGMTNAMHIYFSTKPFEPSPYSSPALQSQILEACSSLPGICTNSATFMCQNCTRDNISSSFNTLQLCGCYAPADSNFPNISQACDPLCTNSVSSKLRDPINGGVVECNQTVCVINNITINAANTSLNGIDFNQVCNQCVNDNASCQCYIDVSVPDIIAKTGLSGPSLVQNCPFNQCFVVDNQTQQIKNVPCSNYNKIDTTLPVNKYIWWVLAFIFFLLITVVFSFAYWGSSFRQISFELYTPKKRLDNVAQYSSKNIPK